MRTYVSDITEVHSVWASDTTELSQAVLTAIATYALTEPFLLVADTTFLSAPFDTNQVYRRERFAQRKGDATDKMVSTIKYLLTHGLPTFDYEINVPIVVDPQKAQEVAQMGHKYLFRTLYGNMVHKASIRMPDPHIDPWIHSMEPAGPVVSVGSTALHHLKCVQWLRKLHRECLSSAPTDQDR